MQNFWRLKNDCLDQRFEFQLPPEFLMRLMLGLWVSGSPKCSLQGVDPSLGSTTCAMQLDLAIPRLGEFGTEVELKLSFS